MSPGVQSIADLTTETKPTSGEIPPPLVGASTVVVDNFMYVFGGRLVSSRQMTNHLYVLNLTTLVWKRHIPPSDSTPAPQARYFHTANTYKNHMVVFGGMGHASNGASQDLCALDDVCLLNIQTMTWTYPEIVPNQYTPRPRYAHLAVTAEDKLVVMGGQDMANQYVKEINVLDLKTFMWVQCCPLDSQYGAYRSVACSLPASDPSIRSSLGQDLGTGQSLLTSQLPGNDDLAVCVYSNYNFADVVRDLHALHPLQPTRQAGFKDHSTEMSGTALPPGLRFPTGHLLGHHMILTGTYLTPTHRSFHIWALNLANLVWMRIDTGSMFSTGSWSRGVLGDNSQMFYVLGHKDRDLLDDYNRRQVNFDHVAKVDMEAFGIYLHPSSTCAPIAQELGLSMLNEPSMADVHLVTTDKKSIPANAAILAQRWNYFAKLLEESGTSSSSAIRFDEQQQPPHRTLMFPESYAVTLAFLQYIYTDHLMTAQQHQPHILSRLLILADMYAMPRLIQLATHALHQILTISTASMVYETAALTCRTALQIRALRVMINAKKMLQQQQQSVQEDPESVSKPKEHPESMIRSTSHNSDGSSTTAPGPSGAATYRRLATSRSSTTTASESFSPMPKMSKSGTVLSAHTHASSSSSSPSPTMNFRKGSVATISSKTLDRPNIGIRF